MSADHIEIRRLAQEDAADAVLYRDIRLEALQANPEAFGSIFEVENAQPLSLFSARLGSSTVLGAFRDRELVGIAGFAVQQGLKRVHKGTLWGMYVRPAARNAKVGRRLVEAVCNHAGQQVELIQLSVVLDNEQARSLYARLGFLEYGVEKNALKQAGRYWQRISWGRHLPIPQEPNTLETGTIDRRVDFPRCAGGLARLAIVRVGTRSLPIRRLAVQALRSTRLVETIAHVRTSSLQLRLRGRTGPVRRGSSSCAIIRRGRQPGHAPNSKGES
jgi:ribosomal protein S18 acetylase RimI-like enzyme